jgi:hypothetical protein
MSGLNYNYFVVEFQKDNACINKLYEQIISSGPETFSSFDEYCQIIRFLITNYVQYNDYLHSNNLLQSFRIYCNSKSIRTDKYDWFQYYSIKIYSKRSIKYYLDNPRIFWETVYSLANNLQSSYIERLDNLLVDTLEFYKREYVNYPEFLFNSMTRFVKYYFANKSYSPTITSHLNELKRLISANEKDKVLEIYNNLQSQNIREIEIPENISVNSSEYKVLVDEIEKEKIIEENYYGDICLADEDHDKKIMVIGDDPFVHKTNIIFGIAKEYNILKEQFEFYTDYERIKQEGERIVSKTQYRSDKYIGIIFGSNPHSTSGNNGSSSLIAKVTSEPGFPYAIVCRGEGQNSKLKITKSSFKKALREIIINFKSK